MGLRLWAWPNGYNPETLLLSFQCPSSSGVGTHSSLFCLRKFETLASPTKISGIALIEEEMPSDDSKPLKKENIEEDDDDEKSLGSIIRDKNKKKSASATKLPKPIGLDSSQKKNISKPVKAVKKVEPPASDSDDDKPISKKSAAKDDNKSKIKSKKKEEVKKKVEVEVKKRERKVYALPGQKRDPPEERDPLRIFYETLYEQVSDSDMAAIWMMESGLLPQDVAKRVFDKKQKKSQHLKLGSPMKSVSTARKKDAQSKSVTVKKGTDSSSKSSNKKNATSGSTVKAKKRKKSDSSDEEDSEDDFVISKVVKKQRV